MDFVTIDFETGQYAPESAVSVGMVKYRGGEAVDSFYSLIRPPSLYIIPRFTAIHGLTADDVRDAPRFPELWEKMLPFAEGLPLAAHNAPFDMKVLESVLDYYDIAPPSSSSIEYFCTLALSRRAWPGLRSHALSALGAHFRIDYEAHNALADAETCGRLALLAAEKYGVSSVGDLLRAASLGRRHLF